MARILSFALSAFLTLFILAPSAHADRDLERLYTKANLTVGKKKITAYVADDQQERNQGLMYVTKLPPDTGMLFVFEYPHVLSFWMKNTLIPLSIGYFDESATLIEVVEMKVVENMMTLEPPPSYPSSRPALFALEMPAGWFKKNAIAKGARLKADSFGKSDLLKARLPTK